MAQIDSGIKKCNLGFILLFLGILILAISACVPINFFVSMMTGLTLMLIALVRFVKNICSECRNIVSDKETKCPSCSAIFYD